MNKQPRRFMSWKDLVITPLIEMVLFLLSFEVSFLVKNHCGLDVFTFVVLYCIVLVFFTLAVLKILRVSSWTRVGILSPESDPCRWYVWNLYSFLCTTNLALAYNNTLIPPPLRKIFYQLLGSKIGQGIVLIGGKLLEAHLISIEEGAAIGEDAVLTAHALSNLGPHNFVVLGKIEIKMGALVGARSMIMPGVTVGEYAVINAMSLVPMNTRIPAYEIWGGIPAKKMGEAPRREAL